jgi:hypothetical protein
VGRAGNEALKKLLKDKLISEDDERRAIRRRRAAIRKSWRSGRDGGEP